MKSTKQMILELLNEIIPDDVCIGFWQLECLLQYIMANPESINNLKKDVYPHIANLFKCKPGSIEKNISRLIPLIDSTSLPTVRDEISISLSIISDNLVESIRGISLLIFFSILPGLHLNRFAICG